MKNKHLYEIALGKVPLVGPVVAKTLISYCGGAQAVFEEKRSRLLKIPNVGDKIITNLRKSDPKALAEAEIEFIDKHGVTVLSYMDDAYPQRLLQQEDAPLLLFLKGDIDLNRQKHIAIIGTRKPTEYGRLQVEQLVKGLSIYEPTIISGLAYGIDTAAHKSSVQNQLSTIGVLGHGLDRIYPAQNRKLAAEMIQTQGGLLTEFPSGTNPDAPNFPMRNRIIAALSDVVIVIESAKRGGSIITAEFANAYHKDVFAVPGRLGDDRSEGCNRLIKQHKAALIESADDVAYILRWDEKDKVKDIQQSLFIEMTEQERKIFDYLVEKGEGRLDKMHLDMELTLSALSTSLLEMEFSGLVKSLPGKRYIPIK